MWLGWLQKQASKGISPELAARGAALCNATLVFARCTGPGSAVDLRLGMGRSAGWERGTGLEDGTLGGGAGLGGGTRLRNGGIRLRIGWTGLVGVVVLRLILKRLKHVSHALYGTCCIIPADTARSPISLNA